MSLGPSRPKADRRLTANCRPSVRTSAFAPLLAPRIRGAGRGSIDAMISVAIDYWALAWPRRSGRSHNHREEQHDPSRDR